MEAQQRGFGMGRALEGRPERRRALRGAGPGRELVSAATLSGERVVTRHGETVGNVSELMLDVQRGRIAYAVVAHGGFMGLGERLHAIPWGALRFDAEHGCLVLDAERRTFLDAPGFDKEHWPSTPDAAWHHTLHRHYGCRPYWE
jgi:sporulation protein YlmC with PRC-barrel domain